MNWISKLFRKKATQNRVREEQKNLAEELWQKQKGPLQIKIIEQLRLTGKPRGLIWNSCEYQDDAILFWHPKRKSWLAVVAVAISFSAILYTTDNNSENCENIDLNKFDMSDNPNVTIPKHGCACFELQDSCWQFFGRILFNLSVDQSTNLLLKKMD